MNPDTTKPPATLPPITEPPKEIEVKLTTGQVYKGKTQDEVIQQLVHAQEEASRTISEQKRALEAPEPVPAPKVGEFDSNVYFGLLAQDPLAAFYYQMGHALGVEPELVPGAIREIYTTTQKADLSMETSAFHARHPEFPGGNEAADLMIAELEKDGKSWNVDNLEVVYTRLVNNNKITPIKDPDKDETVLGAPPSLSTGGGAKPEDLASQFENLTTAEQEAYLKKLGML